MRVVFMGTPSFAVPSLVALASRHDVAAVYSRPDAPKGRGLVVGPSEVKAEALGLGLPVLQPVSLRDPGAVAELASLAPDAVCVAAYGSILPAEVLDIPPLGCLNVHASLLPRWRGAAPVERSILAGDQVTGVSVMRMEEGLDTGPVALTVEVLVDRLSAADLTSLLAEEGALALLRVVDALENGECVDWVVQDEQEATYATKVSRADVELRPDLPADEADRRVRASSRRAASRIVVGGRRVTILRTDPLLRTEAAPGEARPVEDGLLLGFADGALLATRLRPEGKAEMTGSEWLRGARLPDRVTWAPA